jgi:hypothetical protein
MDRSGWPGNGIAGRLWPVTTGRRFHQNQSEVYRGIFARHKYSEFTAKLALR